MLYSLYPMLNNKLLGGHYAIQRPDGTLFGESLRLDRDKATIILTELNRALRDESPRVPERGIISR